MVIALQVATTIVVVAGVRMHNWGIFGTGPRICMAYYCWVVFGTLVAVGLPGSN